MSRLNSAQPVKLDYAAAQLDIQFTTGDGDLNDVRMLALVENRLARWWLAHGHALPELNALRLMKHRHLADIRASEFGVDDL
jgi:hypothetical protein